MGGAGYVVVAPTFPLSNIAAPGGDTGKDLVNQPADMSYVLTQVLAAVKGEREPALGHDRPRTGRRRGPLARSDDRAGMDGEHVLPGYPLKAAVIIDGTEAVFGKGTFFTGRTTPILVVHGTADKTIPYAQGKKIYTDAKAPKFFVSLIGAPHVSFLQLGLSQQKTPKWENVDVDSVLDFLNGELEHDTAGLKSLATVGRTPGTPRFQEDLGG